jgi:glycosyltransferase involved in cell wall biosynthesis
MSGNSWSAWRAIAPLNAEIIVVDDSDDQTPDMLARHAGTCPVPVRLLHRPPGHRKGGLSSAVIAGARHARGERVLVMDGDLQHPPETAAVLASTAMRHDSDVVVATRYAGGGSSDDGLDGNGRILVSSWATRLVKSMFPRRLAGRMPQNPSGVISGSARRPSTWTCSGLSGSRCCWRSWSATR